MILKSVYNSITGLRAYIGLTEVSVDLDDLSPNKLTELSDYIDKTYDRALFQVLSSKYILNSEHIYSAYYFSYNAFLTQKNISKSKEIELLLYISINRQISSALKDFGLQYHKDMPLNYILCLVSSLNNVEIIYKDIKEKVKLKETSPELDKQSYEKFNRIKNYFDINDNQINVVLKSYELNKCNTNVHKPSISELYIALNDVLREQMVLLSVEKTTQD